MFKVVGDFHLKHRIGKGNYADVYLGEHKTTGKSYAIKVIAKERFSHPKLIAGLESEVKIMREFAHRNIVQLERYFSSQNNFYLVLDFCAGADLSKFIKKSQRLRENTAFNFLSQIADGIAFLNERNFIHRDLKSANVLLTEASPNAILKIADFGFARQLQGDALAGTACGTPLYMAPEILEAREYDAKADIWSIGCIFYEMLSGHCPFSGVNETDLLNNIRTKELRVPSDVSKVSVGILVKLLERQSTRRASIQDLVAVCQRISASLTEGGEATPPPSGSNSSAASTTTATTTTATTGGQQQIAGVGGQEKSVYGQSQQQAQVQQPQSALTASLAAGDRDRQFQQQQQQHDNSNNQSDMFANIGNMKDGLDDSTTNSTRIPSSHVNSNKSALSAKLEEQSQQQQKQSKFKANTSSSPHHPTGATTEGNNNYNNSINDSDFVIVNDTDASYPMRGGYHTQSQPQPGGEQQATAVNNSSFSSSSTNYYAQQQSQQQHEINPLAQQLRQEQLRQEQFDLLQQEQQHEQEAQFFQQNILQRWEVYGSVVHVVNNLADHIVRNEEQHLSLLNLADQVGLTAQNLENLSSLGEQTQNLGSNMKQLTESLNNFLAASTLYLHAMVILRAFMISFELPDLPPTVAAADDEEYSNSGNSRGLNGLILMHRMRADVTLVFEQLLLRAESCHRILDFYTNNNANNMGYKIKLIPPRAEYLMLKEAVRHEAEGETEEMLGNMERACSLYESSKKLVYGVSLTFTSSSTSPTSHEDDDNSSTGTSSQSNDNNNRKVQSQLKTFCEGLEQKIFACRQRSQFVGGGRFGGGGGGQGLFGDE